MQRTARCLSLCCPQVHSQKRSLQIGRRSAIEFELCPSSVRRAVTSGHVSGAGAGIVLAIAEAFAEAGTNVVIWYHSNKQAKKLTASIAEKASNQPQPSAQEQPPFCFDQETFAELRANVSSDYWEIFGKKEASRTSGVNYFSLYCKKRDHQKEEGKYTLTKSKRIIANGTTKSACQEGGFVSAHHFQKENGESEEKARIVPSKIDRQGREGFDGTCNAILLRAGRRAGLNWGGVGRSGKAIVGNRV